MAVAHQHVFTQESQTRDPYTVAKSVYYKLLWACFYVKSLITIGSRGLRVFGPVCVFAHLGLICSLYPSDAHYKVKLEQDSKFVLFQDPSITSFPWLPHLTELARPHTRITTPDRATMPGNIWGTYGKNTQGRVGERECIEGQSPTSGG